MITAEEARILASTGQEPDTLKRIEMGIKHASKAGRNEVISLAKLSEDEISQLTALGYSVNAFGGNYKISWGG